VSATPAQPTTPPTPPAVATGGSRASDALVSVIRRGGILIPFLALFAVLALGSPSFLRFENLSNILDQQAATVIVAVAGTLVLIAGGIDLSVGAIYALAAVTSGSVAANGGPVWLAVMAGCAAGLAVGVINGIVVTRFRINALIATLGASFVVGGVAALVTQGNLVVAFTRTDFQAIAASKVVGLTTAAWVMLAFAIVVGIVLARSAYGRYVYATGGNPEAARLGGISVDRIKLTTFALSGLAAGIAGTLDTSRVLSAQANSGTFLAFTVLAGVVVGGTSIQGGEGAVWKSVVGCLLIALIGNGFNLLGLDPFYRQITLGLILIGAVGLDAWMRKTER